MWGGEGPAWAANRREEISVGLIDTPTSPWKSAGLEATFEISDTIQRGLRLRVQPRGPTFFARVQYRDKESSVRIGRIDAWGLAHARLACAAIVRHVSTGDGIPSDEWIELRRQSLIHADARTKGRTDLAAPYVPEVMPRQAPATTWTYAEARDAYLAWLQSEWPAPIRWPRREGGASSVV